MQLPPLPLHLLSVRSLNGQRGSAPSPAPSRSHHRTTLGPLQLLGGRLSSLQLQCGDRLGPRARKSGVRPRGPTRSCSHFTCPRAWVSPAHLTQAAVQRVGGPVPGAGRHLQTDPWEVGLPSRPPACTLGCVSVCLRSHFQG